jgi:hypothetical protein
MADILSRYHFTRISGNRKVGPIPVTTTSPETCPPSCGLFAECYAKSGHLRLHWSHVAIGTRGEGMRELCLDIRRLPGSQLWRHNQAGDLPGDGETIDTAALAELVRANRGRRGFTYTHKPATPDNLAAIREANAGGFIINLSADNAAHADQLAAHGLPVVVVIPADAPKVTHTPAGRQIVQCPAENTDRITCANCGLCQNAGRHYLIGFKPKGAKRRAVDLIARQEGTTS